MINQEYNQSNFEALFKEFLLSGIKEKNTVKNYLSDLRHFLGWLNQRAKNDSLINLITVINLGLYKNYLVQNKIPIATINRRLSTIRQFCYFCQVHLGLLKDNPAKNLTNVSLQNKSETTPQEKAGPKNYQPIPKVLIKQTKSWMKLSFFDFSKRNRQLFAGSVLLIILVFSFGIFYFFKKLDRPRTDVISGEETEKARTVLFQGRLTDNLGNPIETKTEAQFKLYDASLDGQVLYQSGTCPVTPDADGVFSLNIGQNCGTKIPNRLFLNNEKVYLGITVGLDGEMSPRQQIGNVAYAQNSERLQGYIPAAAHNENPEASQGATINAVPIINQFGNLVIASHNPKVWATSGSLQLRGQSLVLATETGSAGDIVFNPDNGGNSLFTTGDVGIGTENPFSFKLQLGGNLGPDQNLSYDLGAAHLRWNKIYTSEVIGGTGGIQGYWQRNGNVIAPTYKNDDLVLGATSTASASIKLSGTPAESSFVADGHFGIGTRDPQEELTIGQKHDFATEMTVPTNVTVKTGSGGGLKAGSFYFKIVASDGVGVTVGGSEVVCTTNGSTLTRCGLSWDTVIGASSYRIYKGTTPEAQDRYQTTSNTSYNYDSDGGAILGSVPSVRTAYVNKWSASGSSWLLAGHLGLGNTNPSKGKLQIDAGGTLVYLNNTGSSNSIEDDSGAKLTAAGVWTDASDLNKKTNVSNLSYGLSDLLKLRPVQYLWRETGLADLGFIAQEVQTIIPELVYGQEGSLSLAYGHLTSLIVKSIQEQQQNITAISTSTQNLYQKVDELATKTINVNEKITSPVVEVAHLEVTESAQIKNLTTEHLTTKEISSPNNELVFSGISRFIINNLNNAAVAVIDHQGNATFSGTIKSQALETESATLSGSLTAQNITADSILGKEASFSSTLRAKTIEADNITALENQLGSLQSSNQQQTTSVNQIQQLLADIRNQPLPNPSYYQNLQNQTELTDLTVSGIANLYQASIADSLTTGSLIFKDDTLLALAWELKLSALSHINLLDGAVMIAKNGNLTTRGELIAQGGIRTNKIRPMNSSDSLYISSAYFKDGISIEKYTDATSSASIIIAADNFAKNGLYAPALEAEAKTAGVALLPAYANEVIIYSETLSDQSLIYLTPTTPTQNKTLFVAQKEICVDPILTLAGPTFGCKPYFKVALDKALTTDVKFNWWIVN